MNLIFYLVYIILGILFDAVGASLLVYLWERDEKEGEEYVYYGGYITYGLSFLFYISGLVILCIAQGAISESFKQVARIIFYIVGTLIAVADLVFSSLFAQRLAIVFDATHMQFYYILVWMCVAVSRIILSTLFSLIGGRDLSQRHPSYLPLTFPAYQLVQGPIQQQPSEFWPQYPSLAGPYFLPY